MRHSICDLLAEFSMGRSLATLLVAKHLSFGNDRLGLFDCRDADFLLYRGAAAAQRGVSISSELASPADHRCFVLS